MIACCYDPDYSDDKDRFIMLGLSTNLRALAVCYCYMQENSIIRIISTRKATRRLLEGARMRKEYDFNKMKGERNPYIKDIKSQVTIRLEKNTIEYSKQLSKKTGIPYQNLINLYLKERVERKMKPSINWLAPRQAPV